ncbi:MAG TPA: nucleotidyltransferase family protein [Longimicrobiaceae bacterium]|nr:nucleotidyltransferase family protein [Longimicrobiaceae bacterium]
MIAGVVLAAGRSSRMGSPKALLELSGRSFLDRIVAAFREGGCDPVIVVSGPDTLPGATEVRERALAAGARIAMNPDPGSEQIESLRVALRSLTGPVDGAIVSPVDSPRVDAATVAALIAAAHGGAPVAVPTVEGRRGHPILFGAAVLPELFEPLPEGARTILRRHEERLVEVPVENRDVLLDIDTPEQYRRLKEAER